MEWTVEAPGEKILAQALGEGFTLRVEAAAGRFALQRVNPFFDPAIHENIHAVTECLAVAGLETPDGEPMALPWD